MHPTRVQSQLQMGSGLRRDARDPYDLPSRPARRGEKGPDALTPARSSSPPPRALALTVCAVVIAIVVAAVILLVAGSGTSPSSGTNADPARAVPASAQLYAGAEVRPKGAKQIAALTAGRALTHQSNPYTRLLGMLQTPGSPVPSFSRDVAPWLGPRAGIFMSSPHSADALLGLIQASLLGSSSAGGVLPFGNRAASGGSAAAQGALVLDTRDIPKARAFLNAAAGRSGAQPASYRGIAYQASPGDLAFAVVNHFAVIGSVSGMHGVIDTTLGGPSLARSAGYSALHGFAPSAALARLYANAGALSAAGGSGLSGVLQLFAGARQTQASIVPTKTSVALDLDTVAFGSSPAAGGLPPFASESSRALGELPGESWFAVGLSEVGRTLPVDVQALLSLGSLAGSSGPASAGAGLNVKGLLEGLLLPLRALGAKTAQAKRDFQSWMGSAGVFASGSGLLELKGGVVISSKDPALSRAAVTKLGAALRAMGGSVQGTSIPGTEVAVSARLTGLPIPLDIAEGHGAGGQSKLVIGIGAASVAAALSPSGTLASSPAFSSAAASLGEGAQPSIMLDVPTLLSLLEGIGLTEDPTISGFLPTLRSLTTVVGGGHRVAAGIERFKLVLGLNPATG
jgi:hypothetical protein